MPNDFDQWNEIKKQIEEKISEPKRYQKTGEVMFWVASLSTKQKGFDFYYNFVDHDQKKVSAILAQLKLVSVKRLKRKMYDFNPKDLSEVKTRLRNFLL